MRIGIDARTLNETTPTGVGEYARSILGELIDLSAGKHQVVLYTCGKKVARLADVGIKPAPHVQVVHNDKPSKFLNASTMIVGHPVVDKELGSVDVFFSPNVNFTALSLNVPHVVTVHDLSFIRFPEFFSLKRRVWHRAVAARRTISSAVHVLCDSQSTADDVRTIIEVPVERISVVPLAVADTFRRRKPSAVARMRKELKLTAPYVLALGSIEPRKNLSTLLQAFEKYVAKYPRDKTQLVIAGPRGWKTRPFDALLAKSDLASSVKVLGFVPRELRAALVQDAACVAAISSYEGFGLPVLEALTAGTPVITSSVSSLPEVAERAAILVDPERPDRICQGFALILRDEQVKERLARAGRIVAKKYSWRENAQYVLDVLEAAGEQRHSHLLEETKNAEVV